MIEKGDSTFSGDYVPKSFDIKTFQTKKEIRHLENLILRTLRGKQSQMQMSQRLKYKFNIYGKWESGNKIVMWSDLIKIFQLKKINISKTFANTYKILDESEQADSSTVLLHFFEFYFFRDLSKFSKVLEIPVLRVRRMLKKETPAPASIIFKLLAYRPQHFVEFLDTLHVSDSLPEIKKEMAWIKSIAHSQFVAPGNSAVLYFLDTTEYRKLETHDVGLITRRLQMTQKQVESALYTLLEDKSIEYDGKKYCINARWMEFPVSDFRQTVPLFNYWAYRSLCFLNNKLKNNNAKTEIRNAASFRVFSVSKKTAIKITDLIRQSHHEIMQLIKDSDREDVVVRAMMMTHFGLEESPPMNMMSDPDLGLVVT